MAKTNFVGSHDESLPEALRWLLVRPLDFGQSFVEGGVKCSCSGFGAVLDDERKVAGKRNYFTAMVVVVM
jgi:hypothetical protein